MGYGILNGCLGLGAVVGATTLAWIRQQVDADTLLLGTGVYYVATMLVLALVPMPWVVIVALLGAGFAWTTTMSTLNVSVQLSVPAWVYARALGAYLMAFQGGLALGSVLWGAIAERTSTQDVAALCGGGFGGESAVYAADSYFEGRAAGPDAVQVEAAVAGVCGDA